MRPKVLVVKWIDARKSGGIFTPEEMRDYPCAIIESVGWGYELDDRVVLAMEYYPDVADVQKEQFREIATYPRQCILSVEEWQSPLYGDVITKV